MPVFKISHAPRYSGSNFFVLVIFMTFHLKLLPGASNISVACMKNVVQGKFYQLLFGPCDCTDE